MSNTRMKVLYTEHKPIERNILFENTSKFYLFWTPYHEEMWAKFGMDTSKEFIYEYFKLKKDWTKKKEYVRTKEGANNQSIGWKNYIEREKLKKEKLRELKSSLIEMCNKYLGEKGYPNYCIKDIGIKKG